MTDADQIALHAERMARRDRLRAASHLVDGFPAQPIEDMPDLGKGLPEEHTPDLVELLADGRDVGGGW